jgi:hypothetical protein
MLTDPAETEPVFQNDRTAWRKEPWVEQRQGQDINQQEAMGQMRLQKSFCSRQRSYE